MQAMTDTENNLSESDELAREEKQGRRMRRFMRVAVAVFILQALLLASRGVYDYVCVFRIPHGTAVVDYTVVKSHAPCFDFFFKSDKFRKLRPYL
jgi:hypothetical protein